MNKANLSDTEAPFLNLDLSITSGIVLTKICDFNFEIVDFPFLDGDAPRFPSYGVYISQLIRFANVCFHVDDFNKRNKFLTSKILKQGYRYHKLHKVFSEFHYGYSYLIIKSITCICLMTLLQQGISETVFYGDLIYTLKELLGSLILVINLKRLFNVIKV